jgi:hypothetical protein
MWDALNTRWRAWVIGYGPELQRTLVEALGFDNLRRVQRSALLLGLAIAATVALLLGLSSYLSWQQRRRAPIDAAARCFAAFVRKLRRLQVPARAPSEGPHAYAERASHALPSLAERIRGVVELYVRARYEPDADGTALARLQDEVAAFRGVRADVLTPRRSTPVS